jgi:hypothetical protein
MAPRIALKHHGPLAYLNMRRRQRQRHPGAGHDRRPPRMTAGRTVTDASFAAASVSSRAAARWNVAKRCSATAGMDASVRAGSMPRREGIASWPVGCGAGRRHPLSFRLRAGRWQVWMRKSLRLRGFWRIGRCDTLFGDIEGIFPDRHLSAERRHPGDVRGMRPITGAWPSGAALG